ncbi:TPA: hypothetical protein ACVOZG_004716 [Vibrio diabolicus]
MECAHNALLSGCQPTTKLKQTTVNTKPNQKQNRQALAVRLKQFVRDAYSKHLCGFGMQWLTYKTPMLSAPQQALNLNDKRFTKFAVVHRTKMH